MPSATQGMTGTEIVAHVTNYIGNTSSDFKNIVETVLPLAEFRFCKAHDWRFLYKNNLPLTVVSGTNEYTLDVASVGYTIQSEDVHSIYNPTSGVYLQKLTLEELRRMDVKQDDGTTQTDLKGWAASGDDKIVVHPKVFKDTQLRIDAKITPSALISMSNYPTIPYRYQESFIKYVIAQVMERENDSRADSIKQEAAMLIRQDIQDDLASNGSSADEPRFKHYWEAAADGIGGDLEPQWLASLFR
jgi:hypothetical protein